MGKNSFLLVNLQEEQTKHLAQVIQNESSRKILDYLAEHNATESEVAELLGIPLSTVHYNLQALVKAGLVQADEFHYSEKGREVLHYKLANKYIIIAPKSTWGIKEKLKSILPITLFVGASAFLIQALTRMNLMGKSSGGLAAVMGEGKMLDQAADMAVKESVAKAGVSAAAAEGMVEATTTTVTTTTHQVVQQIRSSEPNIALWFFLGTITAFGLYILIDFLFFRSRK